MPSTLTRPDPPQKRAGGQYLIFILVLGVLFLSTLAFVRPISQEAVTPTSEITPSVTPEEAGLSGESIPLETETDEPPPTPEEVGYTDLIIFCSTVLVLILLVGTLREMIRRKRHEGERDE